MKAFLQTDATASQLRFESRLEPNMLLAVKARCSNFAGFSSNGAGRTANGNFEAAKGLRFVLFFSLCGIDFSPRNDLSVERGLLFRGED